MLDELLRTVLDGINTGGRVKKQRSVSDGDVP